MCNCKCECIENHKNRLRYWIERRGATYIKFTNIGTVVSGHIVDELLIEHPFNGKFYWTIVIEAKNKKLFIVNITNNSLIDSMVGIHKGCDVSITYKKDVQSKYVKGLKSKQFKVKKL